MADMVRYGHNVTMHVNVSTLKAKLSEFLARVRRGERVTVLDRRTPIAEIVPIAGAGSGLVVRPAKERPSIIGKVRGVRLLRPVDTDALLAESRRDR